MKPQQRGRLRRQLLAYLLDRVDGPGVSDDTLLLHRTSLKQYRLAKKRWFYEYVKRLLLTVTLHVDKRKKRMKEIESACAVIGHRVK